MTNINTLENQNAERILGALACIELLKRLKFSAENLPESANDARVYFDIQMRDAKKLASGFGQFTPAQEGAILCLAEYIHTECTTGEPDLERWKPCAAFTPAEFDALVSKINRSE